jgi:type VII secretion-associated protein (TIGR03931 family)
MAPAPGSADAPTMTIRPQPGVPVPVPPLNRSGPASVGGHAPAPRRRSKRRLAVVVLVAVLVVGAVVGFLVSRHGGAGTTEAAQVNPPAGEHLISQYDYRFTTPKGWAESASNAPDLEVQISPVNVISNDAIYVREYRLSYDSTKDRARAVSELQPEVFQAGYLNFTSSLTFANRMVAYYQQPGNDATVDWYVLFQGKVQVSIGCQYPDADLAKVQRACEQVVAGITIGK